jgi:isochorismate hydrolase
METQDPLRGDQRVQRTTTIDRLTCDVTNSQLIVIDIQTKLGQVMPAKVINRVIENTGLLLKAAGLMTIPVLVSQQYPTGLGPLEPRVAEHLPDSATHFEKTCFSCTGAESFLDELESTNRHQVILTGMEAHVCVLQTAMDLHRRGMPIFVVGDAVCSRRLDNYQNALERLQHAGVIVTSTESVVFEWLRDARHEHFKTIASLLR